MPEIFSWTKRALEVLCCKLLVLCLHTYLFLWRRIKQRCEPTYFAKNMLILWYRYTYNISENYAFKRFENYCCICVICMKWMNIHEYYMMMYFLEKRFDYAFFFFAFSMQGYIVCKYDLVFECISLKCLQLLSKRNGKSYFIFIPIRDFYFWITLRNALDGSWNQK